MLADHLGYAAGCGVGDLLGDTTWDLDGLGVMDRLADRVRNSLHASLAHVTAGLVGHLLGDGMRHHLANLIGASAGLGFGNHFADLVGANASLRLGNHLANLVGANAGLGFGNHRANLIGASLDLVLADVLANLVGAGLDFVLANVAADLVGHLLGDRLTLITNAVDRLPRDGGNPNLLADLGGGTLDGDDLALAGNVNAAAAAGIPLPATRLTDILLDDRTGAFGDFRLPVSATNLHLLGVVNRLANGVANFFAASLGNVPCAGDRLIFTHAVVTRLVTSMTLLFPPNTPDSLHHNVTAHLTARGATTVTRRATVPRFCLSGNKLQSHAGNEGRIKKASHVSLPPFELRVDA